MNRVLVAAFLAAQFRDVTSRSGINAYITSGGPKKSYVLEVNGSGACWIDFDKDGWIDLYLVNGSSVDALQGRIRRQYTNHLYRNNRDGTFRDVTASAGVAGRGWGFGCVAADYDNDGDTDLFVTNLGPNILYQNRGDGTFADVAGKAGVAGGDIWHTGAAFGDYDLDGRLDLFVPGYLRFDPRKPELKTCEYEGIRVHACGPIGYPGDADTLYHNNGDGTFSDVTSSAGVADRKLYYGFQAVWDDFDNDGGLDLFVANDSNPNYLYRNKGDGTFEEIGAQAGVAYSADGKEMSSMGVAAGDYDRDGWMDLFVTTFDNDNYILFHNDGGGNFSDVSYPSGVGEPTVPFLGWATFFFDHGNDGLLDLACFNGHVYPEVDGRGRRSYRQPLQLFGNLGDGRFRDISSESGFTALGPQAARGGAYADIDNDGDLDFIVSNMDGKPMLVGNAGGAVNNWLRIEMEGKTVNRTGVGARVKITAGGVTQYATLRAGESYLSSHDPRLHFGLGKAREAQVEVRWPGGLPELFTAAANRTVRLRQGDGSPVK
jgi:hypothetical protein